jgi:EAL domain-containing protein (putative c-di-GMP-specific phosphodiesterase class I)
MTVTRDPRYLTVEPWREGVEGSDAPDRAANALGGPRAGLWLDDAPEPKGSLSVWIGRIRDALEQDRFTLYAQPIIDLRTQAVVQHEVLIRMISPAGHVIAPGYFLPAAEEFGLITDIDRWVIGQTAQWAARGHHLEFNLSARSLADGDLLGFIKRTFARHGASLSSVVCEITETAFLGDLAIAECFVRGLQAVGCPIALDDFGSGYGGFAYLKRLALSYLKIDQEFVLDLTREASSRHVVSAVVELSRAFGLRTIAEGVEDQATLTLLTELGVDQAQGYAIARPAPIAEVLSQAGYRPNRAPPLPLASRAGVL